MVRVITGREIAGGFLGALELARGSTRGLQFFDVSERGFWMSFWAPVLVAPLHLLMSLLAFAEGGVAVDLGLYLVVEVLAYVIAWTAFPVVTVHIVNALGLAPRFVPMIIAYNWAGALQSLAYFPLGVVSAAGTVSVALTGALQIGFLIAILVYQGFVIRSALGVAVHIAAAFVAFDLMLGLMVQRWTLGLIT